MFGHAGNKIIVLGAGFYPDGTAGGFAYSEHLGGGCGSQLGEFFADLSAEQRFTANSIRTAQSKGPSGSD